MKTTMRRFGVVLTIPCVVAAQSLAACNSSDAEVAGSAADGSGGVGSTSSGGHAGNAGQSGGGATNNTGGGAGGSHGGAAGKAGASGGTSAGVGGAPSGTGGASVGMGGAGGLAAGAGGAPGQGGVGGTTSTGAWAVDDAGTAIDLIDVWASSAGTYYVLSASDAGTGDFTFFERSSSGWVQASKPVELLKDYTSAPAFKALWGFGSSVYVAGAVAFYRGGVLKYDVGAWSLAWDNGDWNGTAHGPIGGPIYAIGGDSQGTFTGIDTSGAFVQSTTPPTTFTANPSLSSVAGGWVEPNGELYALADGIYHFANNAWQKELDLAGSFETLRDAWGDGQGLVLAVGSSGKIYHRTNGTWEAETSPMTNDLTAVWGTSADNVYAVGKHGTIVHRVGGVWSVESSSTNADLHGVWGVAGGDVMAVGASGTVVRRRAAP